MQIGVIKCDKAVVFPDATMTDNAIEFTENSEYKYLSAFPILENGDFAAVASKDMKEWVLCIGAYIDGEMVDVREIAKQLQDMAIK